MGFIYIVKRAVQELGEHLPAVNSLSRPNILTFIYIEKKTQLKPLKKRLLRFIHRFKSDLMNNMDHMHISDTPAVSLANELK